MKVSQILALLGSVCCITACGEGASSSDAGATARDAAADDAADDAAARADATGPDAVASDAIETIDGAQLGIGPAGGTVDGPDGARVIIPAGALAAFVQIEVTRPSATTPSFPPTGTSSAGFVFAFTPHGTAFASPVTIRLPFDPSLVASGSRVRLYRADPGGSFAVVSATVAGNFLVAEVDRFSYYGPGYPSPAALTFSELAQQCAREALSGYVWCWGSHNVARGSGLDGPPGIFTEPTRLPPRSLTDIVTTALDICGRDATDVWCIGGGEIARDLPPPVQPPLREWVRKPMPAGVILTDLVGGGHSVCGIGAPNSPDPTQVGRVFCWGDNTVGQLGRDVFLPNAWEVQPVTTTQKYVAIAASGSAVCGAREGSGEVDCWGGNVFGEVAAGSLGSYDMTPTPTPRGLVVVLRKGALAGAGTNLCGLQADGTAYCWGDNSDGQMGNGTTSSFGQNHRPPSEVPGLKFKSIWPGPTMCGITLDDRTYCWGQATQGSIGNGMDDAGGPPVDRNRQKFPAPVAAPSGVVFESMSRLDSGRCARTTRNEIYCWGANRYFDLGGGSASPEWTNVPMPIKSANLSRMMP
jgi:hypothetical protein